MTLPAPSSRLSVLLLGLLGMGGITASCQSAGGEVAAARQSTAVALAVPVAPTSAVDSLAPTPLVPLPDVPPELRAAVAELRGRLGPEAAALRPEVLERACVGYLNLRQAGRISRPGILAVADMDLPSSEPRLWVLDLRAGQVLHRSPVAHGRGSGDLRARRFSNTIKSACTSLGFYRTQDTYRGKHGLSRRLRGLDAGQNDNALRRYVVLHSADYVSAAYLERHGQAGNSRGCPALPPDQYRAIMGPWARAAACTSAAPAWSRSGSMLPKQPSGWRHGGGSNDWMVIIHP
ncbi:murein L,D-transpeptidase catalytic domain family protein [Hymenobacter lapidiphilus]|uniref:murein L,D-transpeptidase catalytic domain family protein n=1 Tax=Hymenobacter sp. CCM 8763 TaxID=2303334 RepID=UPI00167E62CE|nr:murein L,D-transpeptidase catalytic domain family protein [Hymenobacter sp. CCM 8763]